jgi:hypothetical protein
MNAFAEQAARLAIEGWFRAAGRPRVEMLLESMYTPASEARVFMRASSPTVKRCACRLCSASTRIGRSCCSRSPPDVP